MINNMSRKIEILKIMCIFAKIGRPQKVENQ